MAGKKWERNNNRKQSGQYFALPHAVMTSANYIRLSSHAVRLLNDLGLQYNGKNNGDLCATWSIMKQRGWKSASTLYKAVKELLGYGFIIVSRRGGRHLATLYALTWNSVDECKGKLDINSTIAPLGYWRTIKPDLEEHK
jgi:hypothetical protein